jgi:hypothetical protein
MARALRGLLEWLAAPLTARNNDSDEKLRLIGRRVLAALWVVGPDALGNVSASALGRKVGIHKALMSETVCEFTRRFGVRNRYQSHGRSGRHESKLVPIAGDTVMSDTLRSELEEQCGIGGGVSKSQE